MEYKTPISALFFANNIKTRAFVSIVFPKMEYKTPISALFFANIIMARAFVSIVFSKMEHKTLISALFFANIIMARAFANTALHNTTVYTPFHQIIYALSKPLSIKNIC
jgi:hypothetical protein